MGTHTYGSVPASDGDEAPSHQHENNVHGLHRHLSLFDLVCVGVGATVGSGVFVLIGLIARTEAGPAVSLSWLIAGGAACASGLCYAELGGRFPSAGSSYVYAKQTMGECAAVVAGACLTLEYTGSASAVARSWGDKVTAYVSSHGGGENFWILDPGLGINPCALLVSLGSVLLLLDGVKESKSVTNFFSTLNVSLVFFMAAMSLALAKRENMTPFVPPEFGVCIIVRISFHRFDFSQYCCFSSS